MTRNLKKYLLYLTAGLILAIASLVAPIFSYSTFAEPDNSSEIIDLETYNEPDAETTNQATEETTSETDNETDEPDTDNCYSQIGAIGWLICPTTGVLAQAIDSIYGVISELLTITPISTADDSSTFLIWQIMRDFTNIVFIIVFLIVIYSQLTGIGINNYGVKRVLPRLIIAAILVNMSYIICTIAVDVSNLLGAGLRGLFTSVEDQIIAAGALSDATVSWSELAAVLLTGTGAGILAIGLSGGFIAFLWALVPVLVAGVLAVVIGLLTIGFRQALVFLLVIISPLAFVAYLLPNTEKYFLQWKNLFISMLIFYPLFSLLIGASSLAGWALIAVAAETNASAFFIILGMALQVLPLFYSISLLKMSTTALGGISGFLSNLGAKITGSVRNTSQPNHEAARQRYFANSNLPSAHLRRYLDYRRILRETNTNDNLSTRQSKAISRVQNKIAGGHYDPGKNTDLKANRYTREAKQAKIAQTEAATATLDTEHILNTYGNLFHNQKAGDRALGKAATHAYLERWRAQTALVNDNEQDAYDLFSAISSMGTHGHDSYDFQHYVVGAAGVRGEHGAENVVAQSIALAAAQESRHRRDSNILQNKYNYNKTAVRSMLAGYMVDDNGLAVNQAGQAIEKTPGQLLRDNPSQLIPYDTKDERGDLYYDMKDVDGNFVTRVYRKDSATVKELIANFDMPIQDPFNQLLGILSGVEEGSVNAPGLEHVGLKKFATTIGHAMLSSRYKEKAAFAGPMYSTSVANAYISDYGHQALARLDNINKTVKPGGFMIQDAFEFDQLGYIMNPENWNQIFTEDSLRSYRNVNGEHLAGTRFILDDSGEYRRNSDGSLATEKIPLDQATYNDLMNTVLTKFINPVAPKMTAMMSRITQNTADQLKPGVDKSFSKLADILKYNNNAAAQNRYGDLLADPYAERDQSVVNTSRAIRAELFPDNQLNLHPRPTNNPAAYYSVHLDEILSDNISDPDQYAYEVTNLARSLNHPVLVSELEQFFASTPLDDLDLVHEQVIQIFDNFFSRN